jgi:hypothetical protein
VVSVIAQHTVRRVSMGGKVFSNLFCIGLFDF